MARVLIVGAGLTGCTLAHRLAREGVGSVLLERAPVPGGLIRSEHMEGVLYEPHGSHIFHTEDEEVWELANPMTPFNDYRHRVDIVVEGKVLNWPILLSDIDAQSRSEEIRAELREREGLDAAARAEAANFEDWCLDLMGPILYERYIKPYTEKQWGRPARELSAQWAPRRVSVRWDNDPYLFPDPFQGWPAGPNGYTDLIDGLLDERADRGALRHRGHARQPRRARPGGARRRHRAHLPTGRLLRRALRRARVAGHPGVVGARAARGARPGGDGRELPRARVPLHPHPRDQARLAPAVRGHRARLRVHRRAHALLPRSRASGTGRSTTATRTSCARSSATGRTFFAGRLANYLYIDMDDCMRQALDAAEGEVLPALRRSEATAR